MKGATRCHLGKFEMVQAFMPPRPGDVTLPDKTSVDFGEPSADIQRLVLDVVFGWCAARRTPFVYMGKPSELSPTMINLYIETKQTLSQVDIFEAPPPIVIGKPIGLLEMMLFHDYDATKKMLDELR